jgi:hypothetical protein
MVNCATRKDIEVRKTSAQLRNSKPETTRFFNKCFSFKSEIHLNCLSFTEMIGELSQTIL